MTSSSLNHVTFPAVLHRTLLPIFRTPVSAGNPTSADEYLEDRIDLLELLIKHSDSTCVLTVRGDSMVDDGINPGDILVVDRAQEASPQSIVIVMVDGEFAVKRISKVGKRLWLVPSNRKYTSKEIQRHQACEVWGVVTWILHKAT